MTSELILKRLQIIEDITEEMNVIKEQYDDALENDVDWQEVQEMEMKSKDDIKEKKAAVLAKTDYKRLAENIKEKRTEIKENKEALSQDLVDHYKDSGSIEIEDHKGTLKRMKFSVRLVN